MPLPYTGKRGELNFEEDLIAVLQSVGWKDGILKNADEKALIENWRQILNVNNKAKLNGVELSDNEMMQIMDYVRLNCNTPVKANIFINGKDICIIRDGDSKDIEHAGKEVYLEIFDPVEIAGGNSKYQIAEQINYNTPSQYNDRRGDVMLLINGIPVIHLELKASGVSVTEASNQIKKYAKEGVWTGVFSLIQVFFAMTPEEVIYFANPGVYTNYNDAFYFHWGDISNNAINDWRQLCKGKDSILSIPEAHQLIGYYTLADKNMDVLKVARSYQCHAIRAILARVAKQKWGDNTPLGGYVWCTTGGGKTLTSFKAGQLIIDKALVDKVVFVVDRVELNNQSLEEYNSFSRDGEEVCETKNTKDLFNKLKSSKSKDGMMVTSMQKLERINDEDYKDKASDLALIKSKRIVFIIDEAHRSQFGEMHEKVKRTFINALFIGFTGTPIFSENDKGGCTTETVFGKPLATYSIASGIKDENVLGFDPKAVKTYEDSVLKERIALDEAKAKDKSEVKKDKTKFKIYKRIMQLDMSAKKDENGRVIEKGIEDYLPAKQYDNDEHRAKVMQDILDNWDILAYGEKGTTFHAILSTTSIVEACKYYEMFKSSDLNVTTLFDPTIDNSGDGALDKEEALINIVNDYNTKFHTMFDRKTDPDLKKFKKDIIKRLSHKKEYKYIGKEPSQCIDLLIVVDQLLTGFDSQYVNTLYLDKVLETDRLIQAISRTNRVYDKEEKPFGIFRFYRKPYTMQKNLEDALRLYCEGDTSGVVVASLDENIDAMNSIFAEIDRIFKTAKIEDFVCLPKDDSACQKFKKEFGQMKIRLNSAKLQGFAWCNEYGAKLVFNEKTYKILEMRYQDLTHRSGTRGGVPGTGYNLPTILSEMAMDKIDSDYLESHFKIFVPTIISNISEDEKDIAVENFKKELASLPSIQQHYAYQIIEDIKNGILVVEDSKTLAEYIQEYMAVDSSERIRKMANVFGLDSAAFEKIVTTSTNEKELNEHDRFNALLKTVDNEKANKFFLERDGVDLKGLKLKSQVNKELKEFILGKSED